MAGASLTPWNYSEVTTNTANLEPGMSVAPGPPAISSNGCVMHRSLDYPSLGGTVPQDQLSSPLPLSHDIEYSSPSWALVSFAETPLHSPTLDSASYNPQLSCPMEERVARYESPEILDYASDSPSDASDSTTHSPYEWVYSEPSSSDVFITLQDDASPLFLPLTVLAFPLCLTPRPMQMLRSPRGLCFGAHDRLSRPGSPTLLITSASGCSLLKKTSMGKGHTNNDALGSRDGWQHLHGQESKEYILCTHLCII